LPEVIKSHRTNDATLAIHVKCQSFSPTETHSYVRGRSLTDCQWNAVMRQTTVAFL